MMNAHQRRAYRRQLARARIAAHEERVAQAVPQRLAPAVVWQEIVVPNTPPMSDALVAAEEADARAQALLRRFVPTGSPYEAVGQWTKWHYQIGGNGTNFACEGGICGCIYVQGDAIEMVGRSLPRADRVLGLRLYIEHHELFLWAVIGSSGLYRLPRGTDWLRYVPDRVKTAARANGWQDPRGELPASFQDTLGIGHFYRPPFRID